MIFWLKPSVSANMLFHPLAHGDVLKGGTDARNAPGAVAKNPVLNQDWQKGSILSPILSFYQVGHRRFPRQPGHNRIFGYLPFSNKVPHEMSHHFFGGISQHAQLSV